MPVAAVPKFIGQNFEDASPGLRFGLYLQMWTSREDQEKQVKERAAKRSYEGREVDVMLRDRGMDATIAALRNRHTNPLPGLWRKNEDAAQEAWSEIAVLSSADRDRMQALVARQSVLAQRHSVTGQTMTLEASAIAPFTTGLGNEHPLENGFAFLSPYGMPYLPGSGVKGVVRQAALELAGLSGSGEQWAREGNWSAAAIHALFGHAEGDTAQRGALSFWDVVPELQDGALCVEIMTPHQGHYFQGKEAPHMAGSPNPIKFLTVPAGARFAFYVSCDLPFLKRTAAQLATDERWRELLQEAFTHAFDWLGFGAKTAVGYGAMRERSPEERQQAARELEREQRRSPWVDATIQRLAKENNAKHQDILRGRLLADTWAQLPAGPEKEMALRDIKGRWEENGWWDKPQGKAQKKARQVYEQALGGNGVSG